jgi:hypothetical protein
MLHFIDYAFYRLAKFYYKWDGRSAITAILAISGSQIMYIFFPLLFILRRFYSRHELHPYSKDIATIGTMLFFVLAYLNNNRYKNLYSTLRRRWQDETITQSIVRCLAVWVILLFPVIGVLVLAIC